jgi:hypothetical protein
MWRVLAASISNEFQHPFNHKLIVCSQYVWKIIVQSARVPAADCTAQMAQSQMLAPAQCTSRQAHIYARIKPRLRRSDAHCIVRAVDADRFSWHRREGRHTVACAVKSSTVTVEGTDLEMLTCHSSNKRGSSVLLLHGAAHGAWWAALAHTVNSRCTA